MIHLATGLALHHGCVLLAASTYPNHRYPLWNLPGGRQLHGELLIETVVREFGEETGLDARVMDLAYLSESYAGGEHFLNATFNVEVPSVALPLEHSAEAPFGSGDHVVATAWVPVDEVASRIEVTVVREPLVAYLRGELAQRYAGFHDAGVTIEWPAGSR